MSIRSSYRRRSSPPGSGRPAAAPSTSRCPASTGSPAPPATSFTVYDWKETTLYLGDDCGAPAPAEFWADPEPHALSIGGFGEDNDGGPNRAATAFREWLLERYRGYGSRDAN